MLTHENLDRNPHLDVSEVPGPGSPAKFASLFASQFALSKVP